MPALYKQRGTTTINSYSFILTFGHDFQATTQTLVTLARIVYPKNNELYMYVCIFIVSCMCVL